MASLPPPSSPRQQTVLVTGCSPSSLGHGLALEFHKRHPSIRIFATARDPTKLSVLRDLGIATLALDILDPSSIRSCVEEVSRLTDGKLDILINNAGGGYNMPVSDIEIETAKKLFDLNVWAQIEVTQAFLPLLLAAAREQRRREHVTPKASSWLPWPLNNRQQKRTRGDQVMIVNNTSISSVSLTAFNSVYHASKAAMAMFSSHMRLELAPFGIRVVDLKTGSVKTNFHNNRMDPSKLPAPAVAAADADAKESLYEPIREEVELTMNGVLFLPTSMPVEEWARDVVSDLLGSRGGIPPANVWRGRQAGRTWWEWTFAPTVEWFDQQLIEGSGLGKLARILAETETATSIPKEGL